MAKSVWRVELLKHTQVDSAELFNVSKRRSSNLQSEQQDLPCCRAMERAFRGKNHAKIFQAIPPGRSSTFNKNPSLVTIPCACCKRWCLLCHCEHGSKCRQNIAQVLPAFVGLLIPAATTAGSLLWTEHGILAATCLTTYLATLLSQIWMETAFIKRGQS